MSFSSRSHTARGSFRLPIDVDIAFPLFSPRGEEAWAPAWQPEILYSPAGDWEEGLVWRTVHSGTDIVWFVARLDRERHRVRYHRVDGREMAVTIDVSCRAVATHETEVEVSYTWIGLNEAGNEQATDTTEEAFGERMAEWRRLITAAVGA